MNVRLLYIRARGDLDKERVVMRVETATDIGEYLLADARAREDETVLASLRRVFWFPDKPVAKGDFVVLYTKSGEPKESRNAAKTTSHLFYWNLKESIWTDGRQPVLFEASDWMTTAKLKPD